jgi:hypothetical protein
MPIDIAHTTSIARATSILRDGFRIPLFAILEDYCANFWETDIGPNEPAARGCVLWFAWNGDYVVGEGLQISQMRPGILYRDTWRSVLVHDTVTGLKLCGAEISSPDVDTEDLEFRLNEVKSFRESLLHATSKGRFVPVRVAAAQRARSMFSFWRRFER